MTWYLGLKFITITSFRMKKVFCAQNKSTMDTSVQIIVEKNTYAGASHIQIQPSCLPKL